MAEPGAPQTALSQSVPGPSGARTLPDAARIVVIGGGVGGASVAYHLARSREVDRHDVVLLERADLTSGSTFHSAGLVGILRADPTLTRMNRYSAELYAELQQTEHPPGWVASGGLKLASSPDRLAEIRRQAGWARSFGLPLEEITPAEALEKFPLMDTTGVLAAAWLPQDGYVDPSQLCLSLIHGARAGGVRVFTKTRVTAIETRPAGPSGRRRVSSVRTDRGDISCEVVVDCGGMFAAEIARMVGVRVPIVPIEHQYLVTEAFRAPGDVPLPTLRDPDWLTYWRPEVNGLLMGGYERDPAPWSVSASQFDAVAGDFNGRLLAPDWPRFEAIAQNSRVRVPVTTEVGVRRLVNGPEAFTPDNEFCLGEAEVAGFFVAAGFCAHGIAGAGGIGKVMADWIVSGDPGMDVWHMDIRRFGAAFDSPGHALVRAVESYATYYDVAYPGRERSTGRPLRTSPVYPWHGAHGAVFGEKAGWERVNYYTANVFKLAETADAVTVGNAVTVADAAAVANAAAADDGAAVDDGAHAVAVVNAAHAVEAVEAVEATNVVNEPAEGSALGRPRGWSGRGFSTAVAAEHQACRERVALFDETSFAKLQISGPDAAKLLEWVCDNRVARGVGAVTYTQMLNAAGGIEADVTITQTGAQEFLMITGTAFGRHEASWLARQTDALDVDATVRDLTGQLVCFGLFGPRARQVLGPLTPQDLSNFAFGFMTSRRTTVGDVPVRLSRLTFVGELGWEIYAPVEYGVRLWNLLWESGKAVEMAAAGYRAIESLRLEKGYRVWAADITPETTPDEAGLGFCVKPEKPGGFLGREALLKIRDAGGPARTLACLTLNDPLEVALGSEPVRVHGAVLGRVTSAGYGYTVKRSIAYAYLPADAAHPGTPLTVELFGHEVDGVVAGGVLYDPTSERIRTLFVG